MIALAKKILSAAALFFFRPGRPNRKGPNLEAI